MKYITTELVLYALKINVYCMFCCFSETVKYTWEKLRRYFLNAFHRCWNEISGDGAKKRIPWMYDLEMSFLLPLLYTKNTRSNVHSEENLKVVQIVEQEMDEPEINTYGLPEGQNNITRE
jgi:hypothetical protein